MQPSFFFCLLFPAFNTWQPLLCLPIPSPPLHLYLACCCNPRLLLCPPQLHLATFFLHHSTYTLLIHNWTSKDRPLYKCQNGNRG
ncbi:hypothetical protein F5H01DRAFT_338245 [Linnemannia elongata]|nr:hypothetical protein F5H01DRAFT_338245 [Linnemannia elongata]